MVDPADMPNASATAIGIAGNGAKATTLVRIRTIAHFAGDHAGVEAEDNYCPRGQLGPGKRHLVLWN